MYSVRDSKVNWLEKWLHHVSSLSSSALSLLLLCKDTSLNMFKSIWHHSSYCQLICVAMFCCNTDQGRLDTEHLCHTQRQGQRGGEGEGAHWCPVQSPAQIRRDTQACTRKRFCPSQWKHSKLNDVMSQSADRTDSQPKTNGRRQWE